MNEIGVPKVSVVVPVYNADDVLLDRALGSIFAQTEQSFEIVLGGGMGWAELIR